MVTVYGDMLSGNCYKVKLLMAFLGIEHRWEHLEILKSETHTPEFLAMNSNAKIPVLQISEGLYLAESNAILNYLAEGSRYLPSDRLLRAQVLQWQFFEQYSHEPYIAVARFIQLFLGLPEARKAEYESRQEGGHKALSVMNTHLENRSFFVGNSLSIADISLYAYTHVAHEGGFDLSGYDHIRRWFASIESEPGYIEMRRD